MTRTGASTAALAVALLASTALPASAEAMRVVATFSILGDMVSVVGGERVEVSTLVGPDGDAHVYQPTTADARTLAGADLVVVNGLGFEGFVDRLLAASDYKGPVIVAASGVTPLPSADHVPEAEADHHDHDHAAEAGSDDHDHDHDHAAEAHPDDRELGHDHAAGADHDHGPVDPHAWQDLSNGVAYVAAIAEGLCTADPDGCATYRQRADAYASELSALDADIRARIATIPEDRRIVVTSHDAFGYFGHAYDVRFVSPQGVSTDSEASARDVAALIEQIRALGVRTIFTETISDPRLVERIAAETGARVSGVLRSDALGDPGSDGATYLDMMRANSDALIAAMLESS